MGGPVIPPPGWETVRRNKLGRDGSWVFIFTYSTLYLCFVNILHDSKQRRHVYLIAARDFYLSSGAFEFNIKQTHLVDLVIARAFGCIS